MSERLRWTRSLRARVTLVGVLTLAIVLSVGGWLTVRALAAALRSDINAQNQDVLDALAAQIADGANPTTIPVPIGSDGTEFLILDERDQVVNASFVTGLFTDVVFSADPMVFGDGTVTFATEEELLAFLAAQENVEVADLGPALGEEVFPANDDWFETRRTITSPDGIELTLVALSPFGIVDRSIDRLALALVVIVPFVVLLGGVALWVAVGSALRPVRQISDEANRIAPSTSGDRLPVPDSGDEIADLTVTLNGMLDRLDAGLIRQRQFVSDASHELRSPLTAVKGAAELVAGHPEVPADAAPSVAALTRGVHRLETVLDDLTDLAQSGAGVPMVDVALADVILAEVEALEPVPGVVVRADALDPSVVRGHPVRLGRAVRNLLDNAVRHAESQVQVSTVVLDGSVRIVIDDDGPGVDPEDRRRIFERFVRLDDARTRDSGGTGLGLALVAAIAEDHGGSVVCTDSPLGGARVVLGF
ncbi:MAG: HAMP domain-containing sensor histidine kinase [Actinomycetota bacterium]